MEQSKLRNAFITLDGPNGVGKTTIVSIVGKTLESLGYPILTTREPTLQFNRGNEEIHGEALGRLITEDRLHHLKDEVEPALQQGKIVISDRYLGSSLVYRKLDGIPFEETWKENSSFRTPDVSILLTASPSVLARRLQNKRVLTRFEREHSSTKELALYQEGYLFLEEMGFRTEIIENEDDVNSTVNKVILLISEITKY